MSIALSLNPLTNLIEALAAKGLILTHGPYIGEEIPKNKELVGTSDVFCNAIAAAIVSLHALTHAPYTGFCSDGTVVTEELGIDDIPRVCIGTDTYLVYHLGGTPLLVKDSTPADIGIAETVYRVKERRRTSLLPVDDNGRLHTLSFESRIIEAIQKNPIKHSDWLMVELKSFQTIPHLAHIEGGRHVLYLPLEHYCKVSDEEPKGDPMWSSESETYSEEVEDTATLAASSLAEVRGLGYDVHVLDESAVPAFEVIDPIAVGDDTIRNLYWLMVDMEDITDNGEVGFNHPCSLTLGLSAYYRLDYCFEDGIVKISICDYPSMMSLPLERRVYVGTVEPKALNALKDRMSRLTKRT